MNYILWCRRRTPDAIWTDMPYAARDYVGCLRLKAHYEEEWGNHYDYEIHEAGPCGTTPYGTRQPTFVGVN